MKKKLRNKTTTFFLFVRIPAPIFTLNNLYNITYILYIIIILCDYFLNKIYIIYTADAVQLMYLPIYCIYYNNRITRVCI